MIGEVNVCGLWQILVGVNALQSEGTISTQEVKEFMDGFFMSRLGTEMLTSHYLQLTKVLVSQSISVASDCS